MALAKPPSLQETEKRLLLHDSPLVHFRRGYNLFSPTDQANKVYLIERGRVKIHRITSDGRRITVAIRHPGDLIGLAEMLCCIERLCFAEALEEVDAYVIKHVDFLRTLGHDSDLAIKVAAILAQRLREAESTLFDIVAYQVPGRVALLLLKLAERCGIPDGDGIRVKLKLTHEEIACMLGTTRQTVTSVLNFFKSEKLIILQGSEIKIAQADKLARWIN
ncbi:MAG: Crp/Fnr family transcriptional regulator [Firmicutes bacterium]|nr:Crp/Fnr family transcriptional regulator [Bacillota bacterium]MCL5040404.1 Crp/Fnr family transcriptional regulator [Bacillota bacterium]